jgi:hypothetical protein
MLDVQDELKSLLEELARREQPEDVVLYTPDVPGLLQMHFVCCGLAFHAWRDNPVNSWLQVCLRLRII